jgi:CHAD domain-containing protein
MAYGITRDDGSVQDALRRIADEQIRSGQAELAEDGTDFETKVHQLRKRCKKLRGLLRLVRPAFGAYAQENAAIRDAARSISAVRDAGALIETYDAVSDHFADRIDRRAFAPIRGRLSRDARAVREDPDTADRLADFATEFEALRQRAAGWRLEAEGFDAVAGGLGKSYGRARKRMRKAWAAPDAESMHAWRKRVKYHWYHARLLGGINAAMMEPHVAAMGELSDMLGDHHDLTVLDARLRDRPQDFGTSTDVAAFRALISGRMQALETDALSMGRLVLAERRKALVKRWKGYWREAEAGADEKRLLVKV